MKENEVLEVRQELSFIARGLASYVMESSAETLPRQTKSKGYISSLPTDELGKIRADLGDCRRCRLCEKRKHIVFGSGNSQAKLMFVGEGPGADEDIQGLPFVGRAGQLLTKMIMAIGLSREEVYITNVVKCRPPQNRNPEPHEIETCLPFLTRQIASVRPRIICALGRIAAQALLSTQTPISQLRGRFYTVDNIPVMSTYHPAFLLRNPAAKRPVWEDLQAIQRELEK
jgi:DNA polymerase